MKRGGEVGLAYVVELGVICITVKVNVVCEENILKRKTVKDQKESQTGVLRYT